MASSHFDYGHKNFPYSQTTSPIRIKLCMRHPSDEVCQVVLSFWIRPFQTGWRENEPSSLALSPKFFLLHSAKLNAMKLTLEILEHI